MVISGFRDSVREAVSGPRRRLKDGVHNLDLSYVTPRIIGMAFPSSGVEGQYRNHIDDVARFLEDRHPDRALVVNLSERPYDYGKFGDRVLDMGFPDHHAPPLQMLMSICQEMHSWIQQDARNVVAVHCQGGKGRTGTVIASYLLFSGECETAEEALAVFQRTRFLSINSQTGVTMRGQRRYVGYAQQSVSTWREFGCLGDAPRVVLSSIRIHTVPRFEAGQLAGSKGTCRPVLQVLTAPGGPDAATVVFSSVQDGASTMPREYSASADKTMDFDVGKPIEGDILVRCYHLPKKSSTSLVPDLKLLRGSDSLMFNFQFHTAFLPASGVMRFELNDLDCGSGSRFDSDLYIEMKYEQVLPPLAASWRSAAVSESEQGDSDEGASVPTGSNLEATLNMTPNGSATISHQGWLMKSGEVNTKLKRRWFVLRDQQLSYWKNPTDTSARGLIVLDDGVAIEAVEDSDSLSSYKFTIVTPGRTYILCAETQDSRATWIERLSEVKTAAWIGLLEDET